MTVGYDDVRKWDGAALDTSATNLRGRRDKLIGLQDELDDARRLPDWHGAAGEGARSSLGNTRNNAEILIAELSAVERALHSASDDVSALKTRVANNDSLAETYQFRIAADGAIVDNKPADQQLEQETKAILTTANNIDAALARVMHLAQDRKISDHAATTLAGARKGGEIDAQVAEMEQSLRDAGLLTGPPASGHYRQWLENAVRRGVPIDTIKTIAAEHHITPEQRWTAPQPGVPVERMDLLRTAGGSSPDAGGGLQVQKPLPADYDWTKAGSITFYVNGPKSNGAKVDVSQVLRESAQHPSGSYLFGQRGWMDASNVQRENQKSFLTVCTPDPE